MNVSSRIPISARLARRRLAGGTPPGLARAGSTRCFVIVRVSGAMVRAGLWLVRNWETLPCSCAASWPDRGPSGRVLEAPNGAAAPPRSDYAPGTPRGGIGHGALPSIRRFTRPARRTRNAWPRWSARAACRRCQAPASFSPRRSARCRTASTSTTALPVFQIRARRRPPTARAGGGSSRSTDRHGVTVDQRPTATTPLGGGGRRVGGPRDGVHLGAAAGSGRGLAGPSR